MADNKIDTGMGRKIINLENQGKTVMILAFDNEAAGLIAVADVLKKNQLKRCDS